MNIHILNIAIQDVFIFYSQKYNIFRDFYDPSLIALELRQINPDDADIIMQIVLEEGEICYKKTIPEANCYDLLITCAINHLFQLAQSILSKGKEDLGYKIIRALKNYKDFEKSEIRIKHRNFSFSGPHIMGILNVTPDSFSDGNKYLDSRKAIEHAEKMLDSGADIIDIGGESTRPGSERVSQQEELNRVIPVIEGLLEKRPECIVSVDTTKSVVAYEALKRGAAVINDISAFSFDSEIISVVKEFNAAYVLMHMKGVPKNMQAAPYYEETIGEIYDFLYNKYYLARNAGLKNIIIDPGIGFGKRIGDNYNIIRRLSEFKSIGAPILIGLSRKSFLGNSLGLNVDDRDLPTVLAEMISVNNGASFIRTHNVGYMNTARQIINNIRNPKL